MPSMETAVKAARVTSVVIHPAADAAERYRSARVAGFPPQPDLNLQRFPGRIIEQLTFTHVYLGGAARWSRDDIQRIDWALPAALRDRNLNNVLAQYYPNGTPTAKFAPSRIVDGPLPHRVFRNTVEGFVASLDVTGFDLASTVFCFLLPRDIVLVDGASTGHARAHEDADEDDEPRFNPALRERDEASDSQHGLGGYHGSIHLRGRTIYYAVGVYSEGTNGIAVFGDPWKNVCAVMYHELCEARTDPDVEDAIRAGDSPRAVDFLGWYSPHGGEIGDIPLDEAGGRIGAVIKEVPLTTGEEKVPVQLMWSNAVGGPEGPIARKHRTAAP
jgi:hypothetical protein